jgi:pilus assembly protein CpaB
LRGLLDRRDYIMGKAKGILYVLLALVIALAGTMWVTKWIGAQTAAKGKVAVPFEEAVPVVVAATDISWGTKLTPEMLKTVPFYKQSLPNGYASEPKELESRVIIAALKQNEPVTESKLAPENITAGGVSAVIKPGKRAVSVKGDKVAGLAGFINPGHKVDVLVTLTDPKKKEQVNKVVLQDVLVLATGTQVEDNGKGEPAPVDVYTLEVTPEESEKLALASNEGRLQFSLRNPLDAETVYTKGATVNDALSSFRSTKPASEKGGKPKRVYRPRSWTVQSIKGSEVSETKFKTGS